MSNKRDINNMGNYSMDYFEIKMVLQKSYGISVRKTGCKTLKQYAKYSSIFCVYRFMCKINSMFNTCLIYGLCVFILLKQQNCIVYRQIPLESHLACPFPTGFQLKPVFFISWIKSRSGQIWFMITQTNTPLVTFVII